MLGSDLLVLGGGGAAAASGLVLGLAVDHLTYDRSPIDTVRWSVVNLGWRHWRIVLTVDGDYAGAERYFTRAGAVRYATKHWPVEDQ